MSTVLQVCSEQKRCPIFLCDFSPPRAGSTAYLQDAQHLSAQFICVAYNPSKSVRADSITTAYFIKEQAKKAVVFSIATRDMNKLALQSRLLGAQMMGLENVVAVGGDAFTEKDLALVKVVQDYKTTEFIQSIKTLNQGIDYRGLKLRVPTTFCVGASLDLSKGIEREANLTYRKAQAGAEFFITQALFNTSEVSRFLEAYAAVAGEQLAAPLFCGVQILVNGGPAFGEMPDALLHQLSSGRTGTDIAIELIHQLVEHGVNTIYLVPPVLKAGIRDYEAAQRVIEAFC